MDISFHSINDLQLKEAINHVICQKEVFYNRTAIGAKGAEIIHSYCN